MLAGAAALGRAAPAPAQWTEAPGAGWAQLSVYHHRTDREFGPDGTVRRFFADGRAVTTSVFLTAAVGLVEGADAWVQAPVHRLRFDDAGGERVETGLGDIRLFLRAGPALLGARLPVALAVRAGVKLPGSEFPVDAEVIPLTEGQRDWELMLEIGHSFHPLPLYAMGWVGNRWRERNEEIARDPGDERFAFAAVGGDLPAAFTWKLAGEGLWGTAPRIEGLPVPSASRRLLQLFPTLGRKAGPGILEVGGRLPLSGRNLPAGPALVLGYFVAWGR